MLKVKREEIKKVDGWMGVYSTWFGILVGTLLMPFVATYGLHEIFTSYPRNGCWVSYVCQAPLGDTNRTRLSAILCTTNNTDFSRQLSN